MILVVSAFVILTAAAMLDAYGPCVGHAGAGEAAGCFIGLLAFFFLVSWRVLARGYLGYHSSHTEIAITHCKC